MDARTFDRLTAAGAQCPTRRTTLRLLASGLIGALLSRHGAGLVRSAQRPDRDGDGLFDDDEVEVYGTNPDIYDTDGDGVGDGEEVYLGTNPLDGGGVGLAPVACAQVGQSCAAAECCLGFCTQDEICECVDDGFACAGVANGGCCTGSCNADGFCGSCQMLGARCNADAECCQGSYAALCCFSGVSLTTVCTDVTNIGFACPGDAPPAAGCPAGQTACGGTCADLSSHAGHCGACFNSCPLGGYCQGGQCVGTVCFDGLTDCGVGYCVNTLNDALHCGACGVVCPEADLCNRGICQSTEPVEPGGGGGGAPPELDCDGGEEQTDEFGRETGLCAPRVHEPERPTG